MSGILAVLAFCFAMVIAILAIIFLVVPLFRITGRLILALFAAIGWLVRHVFGFIAGMLTDAVRFVGAIVAWIVLMPLVLLNVVIGRWSAAGHFMRSMKREGGVAGTCLYRVVLQRPLRFLLLGGLLEGLEQRVNEAVEAAPTSDRPSRRTGAFEGYTIVGSLPGGGSGAKLYVAEPDAARQAKLAGRPQFVVIKSFAITDGSSLPQIVRESRALEAARQLGLVLEHGMDEHRFFYIMPYHRGDHLGIVTRQLHGRSDGRGLDAKHLAVALGYVEDLLKTLARYHEGGLWHKDVKPDNVIVHDGSAHLVDLGLVTPLRSAMTLTTHGTEYFRDPEMVRMALKGVKVHQVNGAKFDIYAAGAVLYFILENTFPAHGGLSAFSKTSPEATRWVVKRAMTDYNKRYQTAREMLADVSHLRAAADAFAVKPVDLPSMSGGAAPAAEPPAAVEWEPQGVTVASAGTPRPPADERSGGFLDATIGIERGQKVVGWGIAAGPGGVKVSRLGGEPAAAAVAARPALRVTNWWTGAYEVRDPGAAEETIGAEARDFRDQARDFRHQTVALQQEVRQHRMTARRAAREQIRQARTRAKEKRRRAAAHRRTLPEHQPTGGLAFLVLAVLVGMAIVVGAIVRDRVGHKSLEQLVGTSGVLASEAHGLLDGCRPLILINDHPATRDELVQAEIDRILERHRQEGWVIVMDDADAEVDVRKYLPPGPGDPDEPLPPLLEKVLAEHDLGGILRIGCNVGDGGLVERIVVVK